MVNNKHDRSAFGQNSYIIHCTIMTQIWTDKNKVLMLNKLTIKLIQELLI